MLKRPAIFLLAAYKKIISPMLPPSCRFHPSCSEYAMESVSRHGFPAGVLLSLYRLLRCQPFSRGGYDPVPQTVAERYPFKKSNKAG